MKPTTLLAVLIAGSMSMTAMARPGGPPGGQNPEKRLQHMQQALDLSPEQSEQVKAIFESQHQKAEAIRDQYESPERKQMRMELTSLRQETRSELSNVLTAEQMDKLKEMRGKHQKPRP